MKRRRWLPWILFGATLWCVGGLLAYFLRSPEYKTVFLPGATTHGHHQIELRCDECHTPMMGVKNDACNRCHAEELTAANDTHPLRKFQDPRNADRLEHIDALQCVTCHREHRPHLTQAMGVTQPADYCFHCHQDIADDRPSHRGMAFNTCATAGCHNYHDNTALYEDFMLKHADQPPVLPRPVRRLLAPPPASTTPPPAPARAVPPEVNADQQVIYDWEQSAHGGAGVGCADCHQGGNPQTAWIAKPALDSCARCHDTQAEGFLASRHGMRIAAGLSPMTPAQARLPMHAGAAHSTMDCNACHGAHRYDTKAAAMASCVNCHDDEHTRNYAASHHAALWRAEAVGAATPGTGVSCAACHLPREVHRVEGEDRVRVQHNQNANLRPNEKMLRTVCLDCHGYGFALDALADSALVRANFQGPPARHLDSLRMVIDRASAHQKPAANTANQP